jgi:hypothetical protein
MTNREQAAVIVDELARIVANARQNSTNSDVQVAAAKMLIDLMDLGVKIARKGLAEGAFDD